MAVAKLDIKPNTTYFCGWYEQDMKEPEKIIDKDTGELKGTIQLNRIIVQLLRLFN